MFRYILGSVAAAGLMATTAAPASAEPVVVLSPSIEIRIGSSRPPRARYEVRSRYPGRGYVWSPGWWDWQGEWVWVSGHWEQRPPNVYWVTASYVPEYGYWRYVPAHWSNQRVQEGVEYRRWKSERQHQPKMHHDQGRHRGGGKHRGR